MNSSDIESQWPRSREEARLHLLRAEIELYSRSLIEFARAAWPSIEGSRPLAWSWHLDLICRELEDVAAGITRRVIFNVPPRASKSTLVSVMFPCWLWIRDPSISFMFASYSWGLSQDHAYKRRALLESEWYRERFGSVVQISGDRANIMNIANTARGLMYSTSSGGSITGRGADYLILDDPNDTKEPESEIQRQTLHRWYDTAWSTRANDLSTVREIIIQQRTHMGDLTGHAMGTRTDWRLIKLPMEFTTAYRTPGDPRVNDGELLDPTRFPREEIEGLKRQLGPYAWAGQYQQEPYPLGGGLIKESWLRRWKPSEIQPGHIAFADGKYHVDPWRAFRFATVDLAMTEQEIGPKKLSDPDYTVFSSWMVHATPEGPYVILLDLLRERQEGPETLDKLKAFHRHWKFPFVAIENVSNKTWYQIATRSGIPVREISTKKSDDVLYTIDKDKVGRLMAATPLMADGRFWIPEYAPWVAEYVAELVSFPNSSHKDQADVTAYAVAIALKYSGKSMLDMRKPESGPSGEFARQNRERRAQDAERSPLESFYTSPPV